VRDRQTSCYSILCATHSIAREKWNVSHVQPRINMCDKSTIFLKHLNDTSTTFCITRCIIPITIFRASPSRARLVVASLRCGRSRSYCSAAAAAAASAATAEY